MKNSKMNDICDGCKKEGKPYFDHNEGCYCGSSHGTSGPRTSIKECGSGYDNGNFYRIYCKFYKKDITYCEDCVNKYCSDKCKDCKALIRERKLKIILKNKNDNKIN